MLGECPSTSTNKRCQMLKLSHACQWTLAWVTNWLHNRSWPMSNARWAFPNLTHLMLWSMVAVHRKPRGQVLQHSCRFSQVDTHRVINSEAKRRCFYRTINNKLLSFWMSKGAWRTLNYLQLIAIGNQITLRRFLAIRCLSVHHRLWTKWPSVLN